MLKEYKLYKGKIIINFDEEKHIFYRQNGEKIQSVTSVTKLMTPVNPLIFWALGLMGDYILAHLENEKDIEWLIGEAKLKWREMQRKEADIGTQIHDWIGKWILGKKPEMPEEIKVINGITAFLKFQNEHKIKWIETERVVYSRKYNYAGIVDAIGKSKDFGFVLADWKSSSGIYEDMPLQAAGYQLAYEEETNKKIDTRLIIRFNKNSGEFLVKEFKDHKKDKEAFLGLLVAKKREVELTKLLRDGYRN